MKIVRFFLLLIFTFNTSSAISDDSTKPSRRLRNSGDITGKVICTTPTGPIPVTPPSPINSPPSIFSNITTPSPTSPPPFPRGNENATVYIPGLSFVAKVKPDGDTFKLLNVPKGTYSIGFELPSILGDNSKIIEDVVVRKRKVTDLGTIDICENHCYDNYSCDSSDFCKSADGYCGGSGSCEIRPDVCPEIYAPVCGCDTKTYGNACEANAAGVNIIHEGECEEPCPAIWEPVCGIDGVTYDNPCVADSAGIEIKHEGECEVCPPIIEPVCGVDGFIYNNECEANVAGVEIGPEENCNQNCGGDVECKFPNSCLPSPCPPGTDFCPGTCVSPFPR